MEHHFSIHPPMFRDNMRFRVNDIYLVCREQGDATVCDFLLPFDDFCFQKENDMYWGISGFVYNVDSYGDYGVHIEDVVMNYTQYLEKHCAAIRIQRLWRRYRASQIIKRAWRTWLVKKNELWNLRCFVGVAYLALDAVRAQR